jgi:hypothetical protein
MINMVFITGYLSTALEWSRDHCGDRMCEFNIFHRKRKEGEPAGVKYNVCVRVFKKKIVDRLSEGLEKGDFLLVVGSAACYDGDDGMRRYFIEAHAVFNLTHGMEGIVGDARLERQRQLAMMVENSLTKACIESEFGINIW